MATNYTAPGVHIKEVAVTGPISGVGTSTAAFIGRTHKGSTNAPAKIFNWSQFTDTFGEYMTAPRYYTAYAVKGFFENGGAKAYIVRVGTAERAFRELDAGGGGKSLRVEAQQEGDDGNNIEVQVQHSQIVTDAEVVKTQATVESAQENKITVTSTDAAATFRSGDVVTIEETSERVTIDRIRGFDIFVTPNLSSSHQSGTLRIADLIPGQNTFRVKNGRGLQAGSVIQLDQEGNTSEYKVINGVVVDFVTLEQGLEETYFMASEPNKVIIQSFEFNLVIGVPGQGNENFEKLSMDSRHSQYFGKKIDSQWVTVRPADEPSLATPPNNRPVVGTYKLENGDDDDLTVNSPNIYLEGIEALTRVDDVNILCIPDRTDSTVQQAMIQHCENMEDRFAILDPDRNRDHEGILAQRASLESKNGYAALYYPRITIADPGSNGHTLLVPPSGHIAGIYARSDVQYGVHKAPANETIKGALGLERQLTNEELGDLNGEGINVIRTFPNRAQPIVWGARTIAPAAETSWRYVNVRRLLLYIEESLQEGLSWAVFEPNNLALWQKLKRTINEFLTRVWQAGALFGATPEEAFFVNLNEENNPASVRALGQVIVEVGVAPVRPAEFVILCIAQWEGGSEVTES